MLREPESQKSFCDSSSFPTHSKQVTNLVPELLLVILSITFFVTENVLVFFFKDHAKNNAGA